MNAVDFNDAERSQLTIIRDAQGHEVLAGLTVEETAFVMDCRRKFPERVRDREGKRRLVELKKKYELARLQVLGAEIERRNDKPTLQ